MIWDVFISHASEDKDGFVRPLAEGLRDSGITTWYDEFTLRLGDGLRRSIDRGLSQSRFGVVVLSLAFFRKEWTQLELDGLVARDVGKGNVILPIWHGVEKEDVISYSPILADRIAVKSSRGLPYVISKILEVVHPLRAMADHRKEEVRNAGSARPRVFIGSSVEGLAVAYATQQRIADIADPVIWSDSIIDLSKAGIDALLEELRTCNFAILVMTADEHQATKLRQSFGSGVLVGKFGAGKVLFLLEGEPPPEGLQFDIRGPRHMYFRKASLSLDRAMQSVRQLIESGV